MKNKKEFSTLLWGFVFFLITFGLSSTLSIFVYLLAHKSTNGNKAIISFCIIGTIIAVALFATLCDFIRRKHMVEKPVNMILLSTQKIASGDFNVKLQPFHTFSKYDEYDLIIENINTMAKELSKNEMLKNDFISNVSHELKTPLAVIQNYAKSLQQKNLTDEKKEEYLSGLVFQTNKLSNLISNILKLNKLDNQQIIPEIEKIDLAELLRTCILSFENLFEEKELILDCNINESMIISSSTLLELVFNNLISNAIKFTDSKGKINITLKDTKDFAIIHVIDTGCGISKDIGEHIFEKFYQGDNSHSNEGNGLGLALVKKVIDIIGGEITVESTVGLGTTFTIKLKKGI